MLWGTTRLLCKVTPSLITDIIDDQASMKVTPSRITDIIDDQASMKVTPSRITDVIDHQASMKVTFHSSVRSVLSKV